MKKIIIKLILILIEMRILKQKQRNYFLFQSCYIPIDLPHIGIIIWLWRYMHLSKARAICLNSM